MEDAISPVFPFVLVHKSCLMQTVDGSFFSSVLGFKSSVVDDLGSSSHTVDGVVCYGMEKSPVVGSQVISVKIQQNPMHAISSSSFNPVAQIDKFLGSGGDDSELSFS